MKRDHPGNWYLSIRPHSPFSIPSFNKGIREKNRGQISARRSQASVHRHGGGAKKVSSLTLGGSAHQSSAGHQMGRDRAGQGNLIRQSWWIQCWLLFLGGWGGDEDVNNETRSWDLKSLRLCCSRIWMILDVFKKKFKFSCVCRGKVCFCFMLHS